ncbi:MBL fold metallo-hydrolase [Nocardiopsis baichengensis]|uniref:MBL fold metallo-hydrolase n=1 Tax=Nocardiopsis baichengensis TaxID=280240 RepID=UPI0003494EF2|nr:MBL fold metallo-hydrolase [Nocardiopsis baichengensis]
MLITGFPAGGFETNTYIAAEGDGQRGIVIDPGQDAFDGLTDLIARHRLEPEAVLLTHGHMDHTWDAVPFSEHFGTPVYVHAADRFMVGAPARGLPDDVPQHLFDGHPATEPADLKELHGERNLLRLVGLTVETLHTGEHTPGSVLVHVTGTASDERVLFTGDALLKGELGLTWGSPEAADRLRAALARHCAGLPDTTRTLPGHGDTATLGEERGIHPFLRPH